MSSHVKTDPVTPTCAESLTMDYQRPNSVKNSILPISSKSGVNGSKNDSERAYSQYQKTNTQFPFNSPTTAPEISFTNRTDFIHIFPV